MLLLLLLATLARATVTLSVAVCASSAAGVPVGATAIGLAVIPRQLLTGAHCLVGDEPKGAAAVPPTASVLRSASVAHAGTPFNFTV